MTKIKVEEIITHGEYIKRLIDEQGVDNLFAEQITYLDDISVMKLVNLETKDKISFTIDGRHFIIQDEIEIDEDTILKNIIVKFVEPFSFATLIKHYSGVSISHIVNNTIGPKEIHYLDERLQTHLIWEDGEMV
ncbi:hypothetical protein BESEP2_00082 [Staphylococcus phage vB_SepS_BE02]|nr:hypothetical protein BESEP2_00082 [Staphylococcus phage vB_SepS_BE02]